MSLKEGSMKGAGLVSTITLYFLVFSSLSTDALRRYEASQVSLNSVLMKFLGSES